MLSAGLLPRFPPICMISGTRDGHVAFDDAARLVDQIPNFECLFGALRRLERWTELQSAHRTVTDIEEALQG